MVIVANIVSLVSSNAHFLLEQFHAKTCLRAYAKQLSSFCESHSRETTVNCFPFFLKRGRLQDRICSRGKAFPVPIARLICASLVRVVAKTHLSQLVTFHLGSR